MRRLKVHTETPDLLTEQTVPQYLPKESKQASIIALPGGKDSECWQPEEDGYNLLGPGDFISCQAVSRHYPWISFNQGFLGSGTVYSCQECHNPRATPLRRCTAHHAWTVSLWSIWEADQNEPEQCTKNMAHQGLWHHSYPEILSGSLEQCTLTILELEQLGPGKCIRQRAHLGLCLGRTPSHFGLGRAGDAWLNWDWAFIEHPERWSAWALEVQETKNPPETVPRQITGESGLLGPGKSKRYIAQLGLGLHRTPGNLRSLDLGSAGDTRPNWDCTPSTGRTLGSLGLGSAWDTWPSCDCALTGHPGAWVVGCEKCTSPCTLADPVLSIHYKGSPQIPAVFLWSVPASPQHNRANDAE